MMNPIDVAARIKNGLMQIGHENAEVFVEGDGTHFTAQVISDAFIGLTRVRKQMLIHDTVKEELLNGTLHALSIQAFTKDEWQAISHKGEK